MELSERSKLHSPRIPVLISVKKHPCEEAQENHSENQNQEHRFKKY